MNNPKEQWTARNEIFGQLHCKIVVPPEEIVPHELLVLCHGYGAPGDDLFGFANHLIREYRKHKRYPVMLFPAAPIDLEEYGMPGGRAWWPLNMARLMELVAKNDIGEMRDEVPPGIDEARDALTQTIQEALDRYSLSCNELTIGGFSQGAMLAVDTAIRGLPHRPNRLVIFSGALICESLWKEKVARIAETHVIQSHGRFDNILPIQTGRWLHTMLKEACESIRYDEFDGPHTIPLEAIELVSGSP